MGSARCAHRTTAMDPRRPGSGGSGGQSVDASARHRRRMSAPSTGTRLMPAFNAAAGDGYGGRSSSSSSSGRLDLGFDASHPRYSHHRVYPELSNMGRLLFHGSPLGSPTTDDDVLVMDGVLVADGSSPGPRRYASFTDLGLVHTSSPGSGASTRYGSSLQFSYGKESRVARAMNPRHSEVELERGRSVQGAGPKMQASPRTYDYEPSLQLQAASALVVTTPMRPPGAPYLTPPSPRATTSTATPTPARAQAGFSWTPKRPESTTFLWPPTEEENASISQCLYGPRVAPQPRRLPVFVSICPASA